MILKFDYKNLPRKQKKAMKKGWVIAVDYMRQQHAKSLWDLIEKKYD